MYHSYVNKKSGGRASALRTAPRVPAINSGELMFALLGAAGSLERRLEEALEEAGLSMAKFGALTHLVRAGEPLSLGECAARMTCVRSNITQLVDRLEADGLVRRVDDPTDRRGVRAVVTPLGIERQAAGARLVSEVQEQFARKIAGVDRNALVHALIAIK
jgi:DNA-binding MarR family transcriptional regulator